MRAVRRALVTACALTGTTAAVVRRTGTRWFLPDVLVTRFAALAGVDAAEFGARLDTLRSFGDTRWTGYWNALADERIAAAGQWLAIPAAATDMLVPPSDSLFSPVSAALLGTLLGPAAAHLADRGPVPAPSPRVGPDDATSVDRAREHALDALIEAIVYRTVAAWPGATTPSRARAYRAARDLFDTVLTALGPYLDAEVATTEIDIGGDTVRVVTIFPPGTHRCPVVLATNGLDGTAQELVLPLLRYRRRGIGFAIMEMPGSNLSRRPMAPDSDAVYRAVLDRLGAHPRVDARRIAMFGLSFGGYWAARTAATDARVRCAVCVGSPTHRGFGPAAALGVARPMILAMRAALGAHGLPEMGRGLAALSLRRFYSRITVPLLVIDGECDAIVDVADPTELAAAVPGATLWLYPGDDHCAPGHYARWLDDAVTWLCGHLGAADAPRAAA